MSKTLAELSREYDLALIEGAQFRRLLALAHAEGQLSAILQAAGIDLRHLRQAVANAIGISCMSLSDTLQAKPCRWCGAMFMHALKAHEEYCELRPKASAKPAADDVLDFLCAPVSY